MMPSTVNIVEIIDGEYKLKKDVLCSIISLAQDCDCFALITDIGHRYSGKSFLMNCLLNYLESSNLDKKDWPQNSSFLNKDGFQNDDQNANPAIKMCSKPYILKDENHSVALFLMDSSHVFTDLNEISKTQMMKDIIGLFMYTSSTVIYIKRYGFRPLDLKSFRESLGENLDFIKSVHKFQELFFYIQDWNPNSAGNFFMKGFKGGKVYFKAESDGIDFKGIFDNVECYLMPPPGENLKSFHLDISKLNSQFLLQLSQMIKMKLLNICEIEIKKNPHTDQIIKADELVELFENYINRLNAQSNDDINNKSLNSKSNFRLCDDLSKSLDKLEVPSKHMNENNEIQYGVVMTGRKEEITQNQIATFIHDLLIEYEAGLEKAILDPNFDFHNGLLELSDDQMIKYSEQFKEKIPFELFQNHSKQLTNEINLIKDQNGEKFKEHQKKLQHHYSLEVNKSIIFYDRMMRDSIERQLEINTWDLDLTEIHNQNVNLSIRLLESEVEKIHCFNINLLREFSYNLKHELNNRKKKYDKALVTIKWYVDEWIEYFNRYRCIESSHLKKINESMMEKINLTLDELNDQELKQMINKLIEKVFTDIGMRNREIYNYEEELAKDVMNFVYELLHECLNSKLNARFFSEDEVKNWDEKLCEHTWQTMIFHCDFRENHNYLIENCELKLKGKMKKNYSKILSEYLESSANARIISQKAREGAMNKFCSDMNTKLSINKFYEKNEIENTLSILSKDALRFNADKTDCLKEDFNRNFHEFLISENIKYITREVDMLKDKFVKQNKNFFIVSHLAIHFGQNNLSAGYFDRDIQFIFDKNRKKFRANCIAFSEHIIFGNEAEAYNKINDSDKNFDIQQLISKNSGNMTKEELLSYPFGFKGEKLRVLVKNSSIEHDFTIESLIALQILDIQIDAQKQLGKVFTNAVLTVPTCYNIRKINSFRNVAKIVGLDKVYIISEMNAIAFWFAKYKHLLNTNKTVFFVVINKYVIDAAVVELDDKTIDFKSYNNLNLTPEESTERVMKFARKLKRKPINEKFESSLNELFEKTLKIVGKSSIDSFVITGDSIIIDYIKEFSAEYFGSKSLICCYPPDIVLEGSVQFIQNLKESRMNINDFYPYRFSYNIRNKGSRTSGKKKNRKIFPKSGKEVFNPPLLFNPHVELSLYQDETLVAKYDYTHLTAKKFKTQCHLTGIEITLKEFGKSNISVRLFPEGTSGEVLFEEINLDLNDEEINEEIKIIASMRLNITDKMKF